MDAPAFDAFVRRTLRESSRRRVLRAGGAALAMVLGLAAPGGHEQAEAERAKRQQRRKRARHVGASARGQAQAAGKKSKKKKKRCKGKLTRCGNSCVDLAMQPAHCGACNNACSPGLMCLNHQCINPADLCDPINGAQCAGGCTDLRFDLDNCGACGTSCRSPHLAVTCDSGVCKTLGCAQGYETCDPQAEGICETDIWSDPANCGTCGHACAGSEACVTGNCCVPPAADLQAAIDATGSGTLRLCAATYYLANTLHISNTSTLTLIGVEPDQTVLDGGNVVGVIKNDGDLKLQSLTITKGRAEQGGGIENAGTLHLEYALVTGNTAQNSGGGLFTSTTIQMYASSVTENTAGLGGGIAISTASGFVGLTQSHVTGNTAGGSGGGAHVSEGLIFVSDGSSVADNTATVGAGGGIFNDNGEVKVLGGSGSSVTGNTAGGNGGGISTTGLVAKVTIDAGSRVTGNRAGGSGGGIDRALGTVTLADATIVTDNHLANGTTLSNCAPVNTITNCIG
ncbi:MAG: hypothetical protein QM692_14030 [Thermomicrobiales bacterium]